MQKMNACCILQEKSHLAIYLYGHIASQAGGDRGIKFKSQVIVPSMCGLGAPSVRQAVQVFGYLYGIGIQLLAFIDTFSHGHTHAHLALQGRLQDACHQWLTCPLTDIWAITHGVHMRPVSSAVGIPASVCCPCTPSSTPVVIAIRFITNYSV